VLINKKSITSQKDLGVFEVDKLKRQWESKYTKVRVIKNVTNYFSLDIQKDLILAWSFSI